MDDIQEKKDEFSEPAEPLFQLIYMSRARYSELFKYGVFSKISESAKKNNRAKNITAILCFGNGYFIQYAEGSEQSLTNLKNKILKDKRHHSFNLCDFREIKTRRFPNTYQGFVVFDKRHKFLEPDLQDYLPMTPYKWNLEKKRQLIDIIENSNLVQENPHLSKYDMCVMRFKLLFQLAGDNVNIENSIFWLSLITLLTGLTYLVGKVLT